MGPGAAVGRPTGEQVFRHRDRQPEPCYGRHHRYRRGDCYDDRAPDHDGQGSLLF
jgi:hypothetical protein